MRTTRRLSPSGTDQGGGSQPAAAPAPLKAGEMFASRYRVSRHLGTGSLCSVYLCLDQKTGEPRVLKLLQPRKSVSPAFTEDFLFLARSVSHYRHPGIARVYESGRVDGEAYYAMEKIDGQPLRAWLLERLTFSERVPPGLVLLRKLIGVFQAIQERGCYGVLKPENVFLHPTRGPVIMDFGVPGFLSPQEFEFNSHARRYLPYMAPELRRDWSNLLPQSDIYSLGALLYEILVGRAPTFPPKVLPSEASAFFNIETDEAVLKAMAANPFDRFDALENFDAAVGRLEKNLPSGDGHETSALEVDVGTSELSPLSKDPETAADVPTSAWKPAASGGISKAGTAILPVNGPVESAPAPVPAAAPAPPAAAPMETEGVSALAHAATRELAAASSTSITERKTELLPVSEAKMPVEEEEFEPVPMNIWILLGVLAAAVCALAAVLGRPVH